jgi:hypothetical protein
MGHIENASNNPCIVACVFVTAVTFLQNRCLATTGDTHTDTQTDGRDFSIGRSNGLRNRDIHTKFHKDWFRYSKVNGGGVGIYRHTDSNVIS